MWNRKLCLALISDYGNEHLSAEEEISMLQNAGFDGFFTDWKNLDYIKNCRRIAQQTGMYYQSVHAPFGKARDFWHGDNEAQKKAVAEQIACMEDCARTEVPIMVAHVFIGFEEHSPNDTGVENYEKLAVRARELGIKIAFENTEGMEYLDAVMKMAENYTDCVGFCWDTGHEMCYNRSENMPGKYPGRLISTHINDNLGIRDFNGKITWLDDLHLLPFDGVGDWENIARRLTDFDGPLTFELNIRSKPGRHDNDKYGKLTPEEFLAQSYSRACRVSALINKLKKYVKN